MFSTPPEGSLLNQREGVTTFLHSQSYSFALDSFEEVLNAKTQLVRERNMLVACFCYLEIHICHSLTEKRTNIYQQGLIYAVYDRSSWGQRRSGRDCCICAAPQPGKPKIAAEGVRNGNDFS